MKKSSAKQSVKPTVKKRTLNPATASGAPFNEQDPQRRLGNFTTAGEHARQGGRQQGLIGQTRQKSRTDKKGGPKK